MSLGEPDSPEKELVTKLLRGYRASHTPDLISWNGSGFDLPVLHYRALLHGVQAPRYWEMGENESSFRYNNYLSRFHWRHLDLMDVLSAWQGRSRASLNDIATLLGFPGKLGFGGDQVWDTWQKGDIGAIRDYCETDVLNTYLIWLRFQFMRGQLDQQGLAGRDRPGAPLPGWPATQVTGARSPPRGAPAPVRSRRPRAPLECAP